MGTRLYPLPSGDGDGYKTLIPVNFRYENENKFFYGINMG